MRPAALFAACLLLCLTLLGLALLAPGSRGSDAQDAQDAQGARAGGQVWLIEIDDAIGPATSDHVVRGLAAAARADAQLVVLAMNTPGGLDAAMRDIIQAILASPVPVASYVHPKGARAASAGTYIAYASHVSAMAPATNMGAATPVQIGAPSLPMPSGAEEEEAEAPEAADGKGMTAMEKKMINDAVAYIIGLAELRGRNASWAEAAVRDAASIDAQAALAAGVIDLVAETLDDLLAQLDAREIAMEGGTVRLALAGSEIRRFEPDLRTEVLSVITNPGMVIILGMLGIYGILLEFYNPGSLIPGVTGVICLLLAGYAVQLLPLNYAGLALLIVGIALMVSEALVPSFGILGIGGIIAFSLGGLMLFDSQMDAFQVGLPTIAAVALVSALLIAATGRIALKMRHKRVTTGASVLVGQAGEALTDFGREGQVRVGGEIWRASSKDPIAAGDLVTVLAVDGLKLQVARTEEEKT